MAKAKPIERGLYLMGLKMMPRGVKTYFFSLCFISFASLCHDALSANTCRENAFIVFDGSGSMAHQEETSGVTKIDLARQAVADVLPDITHRRPTGLITYSGNQTAGDDGTGCSGIELRVPVMIDSANQITFELDGLEPGGKTPLSHAVQLAAFELNKIGSPGIVVVVTDGLENCLFNPCELGIALKEAGYPVRVHVISFFLGQVPQKLSCLPTHTGGTYSETNSLEALRDALRRTLGCLNLS